MMHEPHEMHDQETDRRLDEMLRTIGADLPEPRPSEEVRARIEAMIAGAGAGAGAGDGAGAPAAHAPDGLRAAGADDLTRTVRRLRVSVAALAACLALVATLAAFALLDARQLRVTASLAPDLPRFVVVNMYDELNPRAHEITPIFDTLRRIHNHDPVQFVELDMSEGCSQQAEGLARRLDLECVFEPPLGDETGLMKLIDTRTNEVVMVLTEEGRIADFQEAIERAVDDHDDDHDEDPGAGL